MSQTITYDAGQRRTHMDVAAVAAIQQVAPATVRLRLRRGEYPGAYQIGTLWRIPPEALDAYIAAHQPRVHRPGTIEPRRTTPRRRRAA